MKKNDVSLFYLFLIKLKLTLLTYYFFWVKNELQFLWTEVIKDIPLLLWKVFETRYNMYLLKV